MFVQAYEYIKHKINKMFTKQQVVELCESCLYTVYVRGTYTQRNKRVHTNSLLFSIGKLWFNEHFFNNFVSERAVESSEF